MSSYNAPMIFCAAAPLRPSKSKQRPVTADFKIKFGFYK